MSKFSSLPQLQPITYLHWWFKSSAIKYFFLIYFINTNSALAQKKFSVQVGGGLGHSLDNKHKKKQD